MTKPLDLHADVDRIASVAGLTVIGVGSSPPTNGTAGYAPGCLFLDTTNAKAYVNEGTSTSCDFDLVSVA